MANHNEKIFLVEGKRTGFGKFGGFFKKNSSLDLCLAPAKEILKTTGVKPSLVDHVIVGNVIPDSSETIYVSRHLALSLGCPVTTPAYNVNRLCGSGLQAILDAKRLIRLGEASCIIAGGVEHMSNIPHLTYGARFGTKYGEIKSKDFLMGTLTDAHTKLPMAITAENMAKELGISRKECDLFSYHSHTKAAKADVEGLLEDEIVLFESKKKSLKTDEHIRSDIDLDGLAKLKSSFIEDGCVTAGTASGIVDGACFTMIASESFVNEHNLSVLAEICDDLVVGVEPKLMGVGPVPVIEDLLKRNSLTNSDIDLFEINEAFAAQVIYCQKKLAINDEKLNIWGGAISRGHPLGATGARIVLTLARQLQNKKLEKGIAAACIGGGQGIGVYLKNAEG